MPNYFAQLQAALEDFPTAAKIRRGVQQQNFENRLAIGQMASQRRQQGIENALGLSREQRLQRKEQRQQREFSLEEREARVKFGGPLAIQALQNPQSWPSVRQQMKQFDSSAPVPESYEEAKPILQNLANMYQSQQGAVGIEYETTAEGKVVGLPKEVRPGEKITPRETGVRAAGDVSAKEKEIQNYLDTGIAKNKQEAIKLTEGQYKVVGPDDFGDYKIIDATPEGGEVRTIPRKKIEKAEDTGFDIGSEARLTVEDLYAGTGGAAKIRSIINATIGQLPLVGKGLPAEETAVAKQKIRQFNQIVKPAFLVSSRGAMFDQNNIQNFLPDPDKFFKDPDEARYQILQLRRMGEMQINNKKRLINSGDVTAEQIKTFTNEINEMQLAMKMIPTEAELTGEYNFAQMSPSEIKQTTESMSDEQLEQLTPEQIQIIQQKMGK